MALKAGRDKGDQRKRNPDDLREQRSVCGSRTTRRASTKARLRNRRAYGARR